MKHHSVWALAAVLVVACQGRPAPPDDSASPVADDGIELAAPPSVATDVGSAPGTVTDVERPDTARGVVQRVGAEPLAAMVLVPEDGSVLALHGAAPADLAAVSSVEVMVAGSMTTRRDPAAAPAGAPVFEVRWFEVRAVEGVPALDGVLEQDGPRWLLRTRDGVRHVVARLPSLLTGEPGARVYLAGPLDQPPVAYGIISLPGQ